MFSRDVWAVYGIVTPRQDPCTTCGISAKETTSTAPTALPQQNTLDDPFPYTSPTSPTFPQSSSDPTHETNDSQLELGIGIAVGVLVFVLLLLVVGVCWIRRRRRQRAMQRAVEEVEKGGMGEVGEAEDAGDAVVKSDGEMMVLESRISIIVVEDGDDESYEGDVEEVEEDERGRHGVSLKRREGGKTRSP